MPYGRLYLWNTAVAGHASSSANPSGVTGISPIGWHIPSLAEWNQLENYLKYFSMTGNDLKELGTIHWPSPNNGTNKALFNAIPTGQFVIMGLYLRIYLSDNFLTSTIDGQTGGVYCRGLDADKSEITIAPCGLQNGWTIRCVKD